METKQKSLSFREVVVGMGVVCVVVALNVFAKGWWLDAQIADCVGPQGKHVVTGVAIFAVVRCE